jgi:uncharacterized protein
LKKLLRVENTARSTVLGTRVRVANRPWSRLRGLLGSPPMHYGEGLLLEPCPAVHTYGMRYAIDVAFLDRDGRVVGLHHSLAPKQWTRPLRGAHYALELPAGTLVATSTAEGDLLHLTKHASALSSLPARDRLKAS